MLNCFTTIKMFYYNFFFLISHSSLRCLIKIGAVIFYFFLAPENSVQNEEKKSSQNLHEVKKTFRVRYRR